MTHNLQLPAVTSVAPDYSNSSFAVYFENSTSPWTFHFKFYLAWLCSNDKELLIYLAKHHSDSMFNAMIQDLYEIGYPVEDKVSAYYDYAMDNIDSRLLKLLDVLRDFGNESPEDPF